MGTNVRSRARAPALAALLVLTLAGVPGAVAAGAASAPVRPSQLPTSEAPDPLFVHSKVECTVKAPATTHLNTNLDCDEGRSPNASTHVAVDPLDPGHAVVTSTDYDSNGNQFYTTFNGGQSWKTGELPLPGPKWFGVDPVSSIDPVTGNAMHAMLVFQQTARGERANGDIVVVRSTDGGIEWRKPVVVADGYGRDGGKKQLFNDKPFIATDSTPSSPTYGRTYVVWAQFLARKGRYRKSPVAVSWSDDGGRTWTDPKRISGSNPICTFQKTGPAGRCDETEFPSVAIGPDGSVWAAFLSPQNEAAWEPGERFDNTYLVVGSADGGATWSSPVAAALLEDGNRDFPKNIHGRNTFNGYQIRVATGANIAVSPTSGDLFLTWTDNRNGVHDVDKPKTQAKVFLTSSPDGATWSPAEQIGTGGSDQWFPAVAVNPVTDEVGVLFNQRRPGQKNRYDVKLAEGTPGAFSITGVTTRPSNPVRSVAFPARIGRCPWCASFHGDWIGLAYGSDGSATAVWTDMRRTVRLFGKVGAMENIFVRRFP